MKSQQKAEEKYRNICNRSSAKYQYSFGKSQRFQQRTVLTKTLLDKFYDLPSEISKKGAIFARSKRDLQRSQIQQGPPPGQYNPMQVKSTSNIVFAPGRQQCSTSSVFYNTTISYPGPGNYNPQKMKSKSYVHMAGRIKTCYQTISPGPKYNFQSTLLDRNKILSNQRRKGSARIVLPSSKSRLVMNQTEEIPAKLNQSITQGMLTYKGNRRLGQSGSNITMSRQKRFISIEVRKNNPGPGQQQSLSYSSSSFSDFIDESKK